MSHPRRDNSGILQPGELHRQVRFRRHSAAGGLRLFVEHYWLVDWNLDAAFTQYVVPHPCVNAVWYTPGIATISGVDSGLIARNLEGCGRAFGVQFRPGGFAALFHQPVGVLNNRHMPLADVFSQPTEKVNDVVFTAERDQDRVSVVNQFLSSMDKHIDDDLTRVMNWAHLARTDRRIRRVDDLAQRAGTSVRSLQRQFSHRVGVSPKWVIRRYRIHEAIERASTSVDWARTSERTRLRRPGASGARILRGVRNDAHDIREIADVPT